MATKGGGQALLFPDVCKVPAPPAPPVPTPFPNIALLNTADSGTCASKVKIESQPALTVATEIPRTQGDEAGTVRVDRAEATVVTLLDRSRDLGTVAEKLDAALRSSGIPLRGKDGQPLEEDERAALLHEYVREAVARFARLGILE